MTGQLTGGRYARAAAQIHDPGPRPQQARQFRYPPGVTGDILGGRRGRRDAWPSSPRYASEMVS